MEILILSFTAGVILNFMPCILPILLIKIYDIVKYSQTNENKNSLKIMSFSTILGIIFIFSIFSIINILFKYTGKSFNFGFHFQNPYFLIIIIFVLFLFLLNLLNFFNLYYSSDIINYIQKKYEKSKNLNKGIFAKNFISGIFLVLFATPCSIPIIGTVATFSLITDSYLFIFFNFLFMSLGMSIPFILILIYPNLLNFLKNKELLLKIIHNFLILSLSITILWLLYILKTEIGIKSTLILICFLIIIVLQFKLIKKNFQNLIIISFIFLNAIILPISIFEDEQAEKISNSLWKENITKEEIKQYILDEKSVFINISASWCLICNLNNITVFSKYNVMNYLNNENIIAVKIDTTKNNKKANIFYENSSSIYVPKYILFNQKYPNGCHFKGQMTEKDFFKEIKNCN